MDKELVYDVLDGDPVLTQLIHTLMVAVSLGRVRLESASSIIREYSSTKREPDIKGDR
jgi:hypothetical protein